MFSFQGHLYNDDRMFVLYLCRCTVETDREHEYTTIYHDEPPEGALWAVAIFRNTKQYPAVRVERFETREAAEEHLRWIEPGTPLVSLWGAEPDEPLPYDEYVALKNRMGWRDYNPDIVYPPDGSGRRGTNRREELIAPRRA